MSFPAEMSMDGLPKAPASQPQRGGRGGRKGMSANRMSQPSSRGGNPSNSSPTANLASRISGSSKHGGSKIPRPAAESSGGGRPGHKDRSAKRVDPLAGTKPRTNAIEVLRTWLQRRWNPAAAMLDLSKMYKDSFLLEKEVFPPGHRLTRPTMARVLWKLVGELQPPVVTISYESNNLSNLESLESISQHVPSVRNLSIANNPLKDNESIKTLVSLKTGLTELRELITIGCPFRDTQIEVRGVEGYKTFMTGHLPFLRLLDSEPIFSLTFDLKADDIPPEQIVPPSTKTGNNSDPTSAQLRPLPLFPLSLKQNFFFGDADFVNSFLAKFFPLFDTARAELLPVYGQTSTFSVSTSNHMPPRARAANFHTSLPNQRALTWRPYTDIQRNLLRVGKLEARINRLFVGADKIIGAFTGKGGETSVPATKHPLDQPAKWSIDSVQVDREVGGPLLIVTVHGEFEEMPAMGLRSFDRTFILSPSAPDSPAVAAGWPCVILSDQLTVRIYSSSTAFEDNSIPVSPAASQPLVPSALPVAPSAQPQLTDQQKEVLVSQLAQKSGLNVAFSIQCLEGNGWDLERAWANFLELKPQIPKEAYA